MRRPRIHFRSPGVKPGQKIGPLGPFRGRLGLGWVVAPLVLLLVLGSAAWFFVRGGTPGAPWRAVVPIEELPPQSSREAVGGVFLGRLRDGRLLAVAEEPACPLRVASDGFVDCAGTHYGFDGISEDEEALDLVPIRLHRGEIFVDPTRRFER